MLGQGSAIHLQKPALRRKERRLYALLPICAYFPSNTFESITRWSASDNISGCTCSGAGLAQPTAGAIVKYNVHTLKLTFNDPHRALARRRGATLQLTGYANDVPTGLNICFAANVRIC